MFGLLNLSNMFNPAGMHPRIFCQSSFSSFSSSRSLTARRRGWSNVLSSPSDGVLPDPQRLGKAVFLNGRKNFLNDVWWTYFSQNTSQAGSFWLFSSRVFTGGGLVSQYLLHRHIIGQWNVGIQVVGLELVGPFFSARLTFCFGFCVGCLKVAVLQNVPPMSWSVGSSEMLKMLRFTKLVGGIPFSGR